MENNNIHSQNSHGYSIYILVWLALIALTTVTVTVAGIDLRGFTVTVALVIASIKAYLVLTIFMHLRSEGKTFIVFLLVALLFLLVSFIPIIGIFYTDNISKQTSSSQQISDHQFQQLLLQLSHEI